MIPMKIRVQLFAKWFVQLIALYLFLFWGLLYLNFSLNIDEGSLPVIEVIKASLLGLFFGLPLFLSTLVKKPFLN